VGQIDTFCAVSGGRDLIAFQFEQINQKFKYIPVVVDNQDSASV
jgi:hypothetical protein